MSSQSLPEGDWQTQSGTPGACVHTGSDTTPQTPGPVFAPPALELAVTFQACMFLTFTVKQSYYSCNEFPNSHN